MRDITAEKQQVESIIVCLAKFHAAVELSGICCPLCRQTMRHHDECPIELAWSLLDESLQDTAREVVHSMFLEGLVKGDDLADIVHAK